jgi:hypothetical protein
MKSIRQRRSWLAPGALALAVCLALGAAVLPGAPIAYGDDPPPASSQASTSLLATSPVDAAHASGGSVGMTQAGVGEDPCLHCHVEGEDKAITTQPLRWALLVAAGMFFAFGMVQSATVWRSRQPWRPFWSRAVAWVDERYAVVEPMQHALAKPVPAHAMRWFYCLGGITAFLFFVQAVTGIMLAFYYQPTTELARQSIEFIQQSVRFGAGVRLIHHWTANAMIVMVVAHMARTYITGAYKRPRELNWVSGVLLFVLVLGFGFTGYLLPWDQRAYWATTVGTEIGGSIPIIGNIALVLLRVGWDVSAATLSRFYALHIIVLPIVTIASMGTHFLMIRRVGIAEPL